MSADLDLESILAQLRAKVGVRRQIGDYPSGMEDELESELARILAHRPAPGPGPPSLRQELEAGGPPPGVDPVRVAGATASSVPGGAILHAAVARVVGHQVAAVLAQVQDISNAIWEDLLRLAGAVDGVEAQARQDRLRAHMVDSLVERMAYFERLPPGSPVGLAELEARLQQLEAVVAAGLPRAWFAAELDLGSVPVGHPAPPAPPGGVEELVEGCDPLLVLRPGSELGELQAEADGSLAAVAAVDLVERLSPQQLLDLVRLAADKLAPGGLLVAGATNPRSLWALANGAGGRPDRAMVDPGWLALCAREAGFGAVEVRWGPRPPGSDGSELHQLVMGPVSYVLCATR